MSTCLNESVFSAVAWVFSLQIVEPPLRRIQFGLCLWFTEAVQGIPPASITEVAEGTICLASGYSQGCGVA